MLRRFLVSYLLLFVASAALSQRPKLLSQKRLSRSAVATGHFSGIAPLGGGRYAVVSDKEQTPGFYVWHIDIDSLTGSLRSVRSEGYRSGPAKGSAFDIEGIAFFPPCGTLFLSDEYSQTISEYTSEAQPTGRHLAVPPLLGRHNVQSNMGFEALTYDTLGHLFYTMTEGPLRSDTALYGPRMLRLQSFSDNLQPHGQWSYLLEEPQLLGRGRTHVQGVSALCALPDGRLLVLERELSVKRRYLGSRVRCQVFLIEPLSALSATVQKCGSEEALAKPQELKKQLIVSFRSRLWPLAKGWANYEGMCLGPRLADGRQTILLINDSQASMGNSLYRLRNYLRVLILPAHI